jgi:hypothetical protein
MSYVFAEVNFAALQQPGGAVVGPDGKFAAPLALLQAAGDALSCVGGGSVVLVWVGFLLRLRRIVFLLAACSLGKGGKTHEGRKGGQAEEFTCVFHFAASCE